MIILIDDKMNNLINLITTYNYIKMLIKHLIVIFRLQLITSLINKIIDKLND